MPNRLQHETSPYLRQHAENPVDWYPWGEEALARARREDRPILLSVGYSACHWCHVMAHESFEDPEIARQMNEWFVNVKVDREERPDLDQIYQGVVQLQGRGGGWPLTVFLLPDLRPFFGGTYFPPEDRHGMPGFPRLLEALHRSYTEARAEVEAQAGQFQAGLEHLAALGLDAAAPSALSAEDLVRAAEVLERQVDRRHGGFGHAPKFPNSASVQLMLRAHRRSGKEALRSAVALTLEKMARGGIYDQLGGGFHRYSVDDRWLVPHFEKMLYDNAQLLSLYAEAHQAGLEPRPLWKKTVEETVEYVRREMTAPGGGFHAAQDADSEGEEGKFFAWTKAEVDALLPEEQARLLELAFNITAEGSFEHGKNVLEARKELPELAARSGRSEEETRKLLDEARATLFRAREERVKPGLDDKVLAGWNGLMIRGLAVAGRAFGREDWIALARVAADFVLSRMWRGGKLWRSHQEGQEKIDGFLEDHGDVAAGLAALYQATFEPRYLEAAVAIADRAVELFWDGERQAYLSAPRGQKDLVCAAYAVHDNAFPSGASSLTEAQVALAALTGEARHLGQAERYLRRLRDEMVRHPFAFGHLWLAADAYLDGAAALTVVGEGPAAEELVSAANRAHAPTVALCRLRRGEPPEVLRHAAQGRERVDGAAAYLCQRFTCERPLTTATDVGARLRRGFP